MGLSCTEGRWQRYLPRCPSPVEHWGFPQGLSADLSLSLLKFPSVPGSSFTPDPCRVLR